MKTFLFAGLLLAGLSGCGDEQADSTASEMSMQVSVQENTWLEIDTHWTGAFAGSAHDEYTLYFVRRGGWLQDDKRWTLNYWPAAPRPVLRRIDADTIAVDVLYSNGRMQTTKYALKGHQPKGEPRS